MFRIELLPAKHGDAILVEYGKGAKRSLFLIDGGPTNGTKEFKARLDKIAGPLELLVVTHVDADHIEGIVRLLRSKVVKPDVTEVWFNGWDQMSDALGPVQGEYLSALIKQKNLPWNAAKPFKGKAVTVQDDAALPTADLPGGMRLTILSPNKAKLAKLRKVWEQVVEEAGLKPGVAKKALKKLEKARGLKPLDQLGDWVKKYCDTEFEPDDAEANGSSIAFLAEFDGKSCLFLGDAHADVVEKSLNRLCAERHESRLPVDAFKLPHHGSRHNLSKELLDLVKCRRYLFSTNGDKFGHPDVDSIAKVIRYGGSKPKLYFNYAHTKKKYGKAADMATHQYEAIYPSSSAGGITVDL
jgi:beta-lactamase superfamily II metal-dependent hydrolase